MLVYTDSGNAKNNVPAVEDSQIKLRSYQQEMFEESLKGNTIVVMETGSGKTPVAIYRIKHALDREEGKKLIWFLTGSVELCRQQHNRVAEAIPSATIGCVVGADGPELWGPARIWESVLAGKDIMFSTFKVLQDALSHGHVKIQDLGLLIFDEAHHVMKKGPANCIMQDFYHDTCHREGPSSLPAILGLTASPTQNGKTKNVQQLEHNLDAICKTPRRHRLELRKFVNRPIVESINYYGVSDEQSQIYFPHDSLEDDKRIKKVRQKVNTLLQELGCWSAVMFLRDLVEVLEASIERFSNVLLSNSSLRKVEFLRKIRPMANAMTTCYEKHYGPYTTHYEVTDKVRTLIRYLNRRIQSKGQAPLTGIVFACQRIVVTMLHKLLSSHPDMPPGIRSGPYVGASANVVYEKEPSELVIPDTQAETMRNFQSGSINLVVSTDALDEGIDVAACNTIVCFDKPANLRSYVQKRGRARQARSEYIMMTDQNAMNKKARDFEDVEAAILKIFEEEERAAHEAQELESIEENVSYKLRSQDSTALITAQDARAHLHHFCAKLPKIPYVDQTPIFSFEERDELVYAEVELPAQLHHAARKARSMKGWKTERAATRDVSFQAYKKLYELGFLTKHLLPEEKKSEIEDDFTELKQAYSHQGYKKCVWEATLELPRRLFRTRITTSDSHGERIAPNLILLTPIGLTSFGSIPLIIEGEKTISVACESSGYLDVTNEETVRLLDECTETLTKAFRPHYKVDSEMRYLVHVTPDKQVHELRGWLDLYAGEVDARIRFSEQGESNISDQIIVNKRNDGFLALSKGWSFGSDDNGELLLEIECKEIPRRRNFMRLKTRARRQEYESNDNETFEDSLTIVPADGSCFRRVPSEYNSAMRLLPSILFQMEMKLAAIGLQHEFMEAVEFRTPSDLVQALTCPSTALSDDYERLEFLGDTVLKFHTSCQVFCENATWHEGYLTRKRKTYVSNIPLANAAIKIGLDKFIFKDAFQAKHWSLPTERSLTCNQDPRYLRMKVVADVMEALIGAAFLGGGMESARRCMSTILPRISAEASDFDKFTETTSEMETCSFDSTEKMVSRSFRSKYLLREALTHPSAVMHASAESYQRLEFLGDAILDFIVVTEIYERLPEASQSRMSTIKAALVNGDFLAYLCYSFNMNKINTKGSAQSVNSAQVHQEIQSVSFLDMLRCDGHAIQEARRAGESQFQLLKTRIGNALKSSVYPWELLSLLDAPKFVSDMIESTLGAILVDTNGDIAPCRDFLEKIGLMEQLETIVGISMDVSHPYETLLQAFRGQRVERKWETNDDASLYTLTISINEEEIATAKDCNSKGKAVLQATNEALRKCGAVDVDTTVAMSHNNTDTEGEWARIYSTVRSVLKLNQLEDNLIKQALTPAHRDDEAGYHSDGNRYSLAPRGLMAIEACIRQARRSKESYRNCALWEKILTKDGLCKVAQRSPLNTCVIASIRQNSTKNEEPLPPTVAIYAIRAIIGAVSKATKNNLEAVSLVLDTLCDHLKEDGKSGARNQSPLTPPRSPSNETSLETSAAHLDSPDHMEISVDDDLLFQFWTEGVDYPHPPIEPLKIKQPSQVGAGHSTATDELCLMMQNTSLAHTNIEAQQAFEQVTRREIGDVLSKAGNKASSINEDHKRKKSFNAALDGYIKEQKQMLDTIQTSPETLTSHLALDTSKINPGPPGKTLLKMHHAFVSPQAIVNIKKALSSTERMGSITADQAEKCDPVYHYQQVKAIENCQAVNSIRKIYHIYWLYKSLQSPWQNEKDDGFVHEDSTTCGPSKRKRPKMAGNPLTKNTSLDTDHMLKLAEPCFNDKSPDEQELLRQEIKKLKKLGQRFHSLSEGLGNGIFCLMSFLYPNRQESRLKLFVTESELCRLPQESLIEYIKIVKREHHPLVDYARAAKPVFEKIFHAGTAQAGPFVCEQTETANIFKFVGGSDELCAQLDPCFAPVVSNF